MKAKPKAAVKAKPTAKNLYKKVEVSIDYGRQELDFEFEVKSNGRVEVEFENDFTRKKIARNSCTSRNR